MPSTPYDIRSILTGYCQDKDSPYQSWAPFFKNEMRKPYFQHLCENVDAMQSSGAHILPTEEDVFAAYRIPADKVKAVILGQDPYPTAGMAMGLSFSVRDGQKIPQSLRHIGMELESDLGPAPGGAYPTDLSGWVDQGVLLLNTILTVVEKQPLYCAKYGWDSFVKNSLVYMLNSSTTPIVAILWGGYARKFAPIFKAAQQYRPVLIIEGVHPSPLSAYRGFFGSKPFSQTNDFLVFHGAKPIDWSAEG